MTVAPIMPCAGPAGPLERNYPRSCWWVAAASDEVTASPMSRWLLDRRIVLFRKKDGSPVALEDRCAHRWAPLSQGKVIGDDIACPYHGFRFNPEGACTLVPSQAVIPTALRVASFALHERGGFVWIWTGDREAADTALVPEIPWFEGPAAVRVQGRIEVRCNYMLIQENILDRTHVAFLHADAQQEGWEAPPQKVEVIANQVSDSLLVSDVPVAPLYARPMGVEPGKRVNRSEWTTFASPACQFGGSEIEDPLPEPGARSKFGLHAMHCTTPIDGRSCHYWWAIVMDYGGDIPTIQSELTEALEFVFGQDKAVLEAIQDTVDNEVRDERKVERLVSADRMLIEARRILKKMLAREREQE